MNGGRKKPMPLFNSRTEPKLYDIIYADPPWRYENGTAYPNQRIENHYPTMELEEIKQIRVPAKDESLLFLWVTAPKLEEGIQVMNAWGFSYRSCAVWDKMGGGFGYWFLTNHELLLVGRKGKFPHPPNELKIKSVFQFKKGKHSRKPHFIRKMIDKWYPDKSKIELFARQKFKGWDVWGNEVNRGVPEWIVKEY